MRQRSSSPLRFIAAAHAVMPWAFPGYHDESRAWLKFLDERHVRYYAELRDVSPLTNAVPRVASPRQTIPALETHGAVMRTTSGSQRQLLPLYIVCSADRMKVVLGGDGRKISHHQLNAESVVAGHDGALVF